MAFQDTQPFLNIKYKPIYAYVICAFQRKTTVP